MRGRVDYERDKQPLASALTRALSRVPAAADWSPSIPTSFGQCPSVPFAALFAAPKRKTRAPGARQMRRFINQVPFSADVCRSEVGRSKL